MSVTKALSIQLFRNHGRNTGNENSNISYNDFIKRGINDTIEQSKNFQIGVVSPDL